MSLSNAQRADALTNPAIDAAAPADFQTATFSLG
jgi:hypothetical protein